MIKKNRILNCIPSSNVINDWNIDDAITANFTKATSIIPETIDLRKAWWEIQDQENTGSCVGWAATDSLLRWHFVNNGRLRTTDLLSVRFIWMSSKETDELDDRPSTFIEESGTSLKAALTIATKYGCVLNDVLPFHANEFYFGKENEFYAMASAFRIRNYFNLFKKADPIQTWKEWLASGNGPILIRIVVDNAWQNASSENANLDNYIANSGQGGHAVAIVGYTAGRLIIRNSWGTSWGDNGYAYATPAYALAAVTEAYGITI